MVKQDKLYDKAIRVRRIAKKQGKYNVKHSNNAISLKTKDFLNRTNEKLSNLKKNSNVQFEADRKTRSRDHFITIFKKK